MELKKSNLSSENQIVSYFFRIEELMTSVASYEELSETPRNGLAVIYEEDGSSALQSPQPKLDIQILDGVTLSPVQSPKKAKPYGIRDGIKVACLLNVMFLPVIAFLVLILIQPTCKELFDRHICIVWFLQSTFCFSYSAIEYQNALRINTSGCSAIWIFLMVTSASFASAGYQFSHDRIMAFMGITCRIIHYGVTVHYSIRDKRLSYSIKKSINKSYRRFIGWTFWTFALSVLALFLALFFIFCSIVMEAKFLHFAFCVIMVFIGIMYFGIEHRLMRSGACEPEHFAVPAARLFVNLFDMVVYAIRAIQQYQIIWA